MQTGGAATSEQDEFISFVLDDAQAHDGDLVEGLQAASAVGDDALQSQPGRPVNPETWTHVSSEQRFRWLRTGYGTGHPNICDMFSGSV